MQAVQHSILHLTNMRIILVLQEWYQRTQHKKFGHINLESELVDSQPEAHSAVLQTEVIHVGMCLPQVPIDIGIEEKYRQCYCVL